MYIKIKNELEKKTGLKKLLTSSEPSQKRLRKYARRILYIWTILIFISLIVNYRFQREEIHNVSELVARTYFDNSHELRKWISMHDKLFEKLKHNRIFKPDSLISNNYNSHEIQKLQALLPDSYSMMKEIFNTKSDVFGVQIHITSLHCIDSENKPDVWETKALKSFRGGKKEAFEFVSNGGEEVLRMMQPMKVEKSCLNCHTNEQYQVDDIRGGFSIAVPLKPFYAATGYQNSMILWNRLGVWLLGIGVIIFFLIRESVRIEEKNRNQRRQKETNQTLQALIKSSPSAIIAVDMQGYVMLWNPAAEKMFGWSAEEAIDNFHPSLTAEERAGFVEHLKKQAKGESSRMEIKRRRKDGQMIDVWLSTAPLKDCEGQITGVIGVLEDITDQKQAETSYKENMQKYQILFDQSLDGIYLHDCEGKIIDVNNAAIAQVGYSKDELISMSVFDLLSKETNRREIRKNWQECPVNQPFIVEDRHRHKNGGFYPVEIKSGKVLFGDKELMLAIVRDITERKKRDEEFKTLINGMNDTAFVIGFEGKFLEVNDSALDTLGYSRSELLIMGPSDIDPNLKDSEIKDLIERMPGDKIQVFETKHRKKDGNDIPVEISSSLVTYRGEAAILSVARDITERKQVEQELQHSRDQLVEAQKITKIGHYVLDINSGQWTCSASLDDIFGLDADFMKDVAGWKNIIHPEDRDMMLAYLNDSVIELRQPFDKEYRIVNLKTGEVKWIHGFGSLKFDENNIPMEMFGTIQDITERKTAEEALRISEERYRKVLNRVREIIFETDAEGNWTFLNPAWKKITGYDITESIGKSFLEYIHPDDRKLTMAKFEPLIKKKTEFYRHQVRYLSKTGDTIWMEVHVTLIINEDGSLAGATGTLNDITERKKVEQALADSEERFRVLVQAAAQAVWETNSSGMVLNDSPTWRNYTGQSRKEFIGYGWRNAIHPGDRESVDRQWFKAIASGRDHYIEYRIHSQDGEWRWTNEIAAPVRDENGRIIKWVGMNLDITNRKNIENELRKSEERLELALRGADLGLWDWNIKTGRVIYNKQWAEMLGFSLAELDPNLETWQDLIHPDDLPVAMKKLERHLKGKIPIYEAEYRMRTKQGAWKWVLARGRILEKDDQGNPERATGIHQDITERKMAEEALRKSEEEKKRLAVVVEQANESIVLTGTDGAIEYVNASFEKFTGYASDEALGKNPRILKSGRHDKKFYGKIWKSILNGKSWSGKIENKRKNGSIYTEESVIFPITNDNGQIINFCKIARDVSREQELEKQLLRAQKMETIGTLAGGIAHDFNNILTPVLGYTDMLMLKLEESNPLYGDLKHILSGAYRAKELVEQILLFSRQAEKERKPLSLQPLIKEALKLLRPTIPSTIEIRRNIEEACCNVLADATQIHQVIVNLFTNAWQAIGEISGVIMVELKQVIITGDFSKKHTDMKEGKYACISVHDTGMGMNEDTISRIFEPFYTTKDVDKGTGLGLSVVHGIVHSHGGAITVESELGKGTIFHVYLPAINNEEEYRKKDNNEIKTGSESILIVDDEPSVANMVKKVLEQYGYKAFTFNNPGEALSAFKTNPGKYDLLLSDLTMPKMTGLDLVDKINEAYPGFPSIIMTGYGDKLTHANQKKYDIKKLISKPIIIRELAIAIREVLDSINRENN